MSTASLADTRSFRPTLADMMRRNVETTLAACDAFRAWHRENFVLKAPSLEQRVEHAEAVRALLFLIRSPQSTIADPALLLADLREQVEAMPGCCKIAGSMPMRRWTSAKPRNFWPKFSRNES